MKKKVLISLLLVITILTAIFSTVYATDEQAEIPTTYDLRNDISIKVENQTNGDQEKGAVCYDYTKVKMVETYIQKTKGISYNLSETYNACHTEGTDGAFVLESDFPNKLFSQIGNIKQKANEVSSKAVVKRFEYLNNFNRDHSTMKNYIINYGGISSAIDVDNQWDNYKGGIYHKEKYSGDFHSVVVIGWDDNYSKDNFVYEKPENDGAWLVLNSWGSNWGNNGTAWISYEDSYNIFGSVELIGSITLADDEIIETEYVKEKREKQEQQTVETPVIEQETIEPIKTNNMQNIFIIVFVVAVILLIIRIILKSKKHK